MAEVCPKCGVANPTGRSTCAACGAELEVALFAGMFGPPERLRSRYVIERGLQQGTHVSRYRAVDVLNHNEPCLVRQISLSSLDLDVREILEQRFLDQAAAWQQRQHPNILRILDAEVNNHRLYLITEPIRGISLRSIVADRQQVVSEETLLHWTGQICDALDYLHNQQPPVILGCLSPAAIYVDQVGHVRLVEVGLVRFRRSGLIGQAKGVPGYAAPEQRQGQLTPRSDLYALGIILHQLITRHDPRERPLPPLRKYGRDISAPVLEAIAQAYRRDPQKRYASAAEMRRALLGTSSETEMQLPPFVFHIKDQPGQGGQAANTLPGLLHLCIQHWDEGLLALSSGRIAEWLTDTVEELRQSGHLEQAERVDRVAQRTIQAREEIAQGTARPGASAAARDIARNSVFASWLQDLGALGLQPSLEAHPSRFDFGLVGATIKATSTLKIRNKGQGYLCGQVQGSLPWLTVPSPAFGCRSGETIEVRVEARGRTLPPGEVSSPQALHVVSNGGTVWIGARASSSPPVLRVDSRVLEYGPITRGASRVAYLTVSNQGGGRLAGHVVSRAPWLRVRHPSFSCTAGASAQIGIELISAELPRGAVLIRRALIVDSDSGQAQVDVKWKWARPGLELDTTGLDMGSVQRGTSVWRALTLFNSGTAELVGTSVSKVDWLQVSPSELRCAPGASQQLTVTCDTSRLPGGSTVEPEAIIIQANAGVQTLSASVEVLAPQLVVEPEELDLGSVRDGDQVEETVMVGNRGSLPWEGGIRVNVPWLTAEPAQVSCEPGHFVPVAIMLNTDALDSGGEWVQADALQIEGQGEQRAVAVRVALLRPELSFERRSLDFGLIGRTDIASLPLEIANTGTGELEWQIQVRGTWLEVIPSSGTCGSGETCSVQVNAYALAVDGESGQAWLAIRSNAGEADLSASVALSSPLLSVEPLSLELYSENFEPAAVEVRLSNHGVGQLRGIIRSTVPWLRPVPDTFVCDTGVSTQIQIEPDLEELKEGTYQALNALVVESNAGSEAIDVRLTLALIPRLHLSPERLLFDQALEQTLYLENVGYGSLRVQVVPDKAWIAVNRRDWTIKPGKQVRVRVRLIDAPAGEAGTLEIRGPEDTVRLPIQPSARPAEESQDG